MRLALIALLLGTALVISGLWMAWPPLPPIVVGAALLAFGLTRETPDEAAK